MRPLLIPLLLWLLIVTAILIGYDKADDYSTGGSALLRPELHRMSEP